MMKIKPDHVDLSKLPEKPEFLYYQDYGMADAGGSEDGFYMRHDPRDADEETGHQLLLFEEEQCLKILQEKEML